MAIGNIGVLKPWNEVVDPPPPPSPPDPPVDESRGYPGTVGFLGDPGSLVEVSPGDPLEGTPLDGLAYWDDDVLRLYGDDIVVEGVKINATAVFHTSGVDCTIKNSIVTGIDDTTAVLFQNSSDRGTFTVEDSTVSIIEGKNANKVIEGYGKIVVQRCDIFGGWDGIHLCAVPGGYEAAPFISKNYIHDLQRYPDDHCDGIQLFNYEELEDGADTYATIEGNYIPGQEAGVEGEAINSSLTCGAGSGQTYPKASVKIVNNYFGGGAYHLRINLLIQNAIVEDNNFGSLRTSSPVGEFNYADVESGSVDVWSNNRTGDGPAGTGDLVENPSP